MAAKPRLAVVESIRGAAATSVVLYHVARHLDKAGGSPLLVGATQFGHAGVDIFFVLSGFIILFVHDRDIDRPSRLRSYLGRRCSRVLPIYWIALALTVAISVAAGHPVPPPLRILWSATLLPSASEPLLGVAWTLQYEIVFYAVFCVLIVSRRAGLALLAIWLAGVLATWAALAPAWGALPPSLFATYNLEFFLGMAAALALRRGLVPSPEIVFVAGLALFAAAAAAENAGRLDGYAESARLVYGAPAALILLGAARLEQLGRLTAPARLRDFGSASYSIYLFQFIFIGLAWKLWLAAGFGERTPGWASYPLLVGAALAGGVAMSRLVEQPLLRLARREAPRAAAYPV